MSSNLRPFHLAFPVTDLDVTRKWYTQILNCSVGRTSRDWIDLNLFGHQIVAHLSSYDNISDINIVDDKNIPVRHFGVILNFSEWEDLKEHLKKNNVKFIIPPCVRFKGLKGEQKTMFIKDPSGNALEFKAFKNDNMIFAS